MNEVVLKPDDEGRFRHQIKKSLKSEINEKVDNDTSWEHIQ